MSAAQPPVGRAEVIVLSAVLVVAALILVSDPGGYAFQMDPAELSARGRAIASGEDLPLAGPNVASGEAGRWTGPLTYYLSALPFFVVSEIDLAAAFFGLLLVLATARLWSSARTHFDSRVALASAALYATSAHAAIEHRLNFIAAIGPFFLLALLRACVSWGPLGRPRAVAWVIGLAGALTQIHVVHVAYLSMVAVTYWTWRPAIDRRAVAAGAGVVAALQLPWLVEQILTGGRDVQRFAAWLGSRGAGGGELDLLGPLSTLGNALSAPYRIPSDVLEAQGGDAPGWMRAGLVVLGLLTIAGVILAVRERALRPSLRLVAAWLGVPLVLFVLGGSGVYSFHMVSMLPGFALLAALGLERTTRHLGRYGTPALAGATALLALAQASPLWGIETRVREQGFVRFPMSMILSYPDDLWRFPVEIDFPTVRGMADVEHLLAERGMPADVRGRVHGPLALALSHYPPYLPAISGEAPPLDAAATHWRLDRGEACRGAPHREGAYCLRPVDGSLASGWEMVTDGRAQATAFPAEADPRRPFRRTLERPSELVVWTLGPMPAHMDEPTAPELEVTVDGVAITPTRTDVSAPFWILAERHYRAPAGTIEIRPRGDERYVIDLLAR